MAYLQRLICNGVCTMPVVQIVTQWPAIFVVCVCGINTLLRGSAAEYIFKHSRFLPLCLALTHWTVPLSSALAVSLPALAVESLLVRKLAECRSELRAGSNIFLYMETILFSCHCQGLGLTSLKAARERMYPRSGLRVILAVF